MIIDILPETEQLVREQIQRGHFKSVDDLIVTGVHAWRERNPEAATTPAQPLSQFFLGSGALRPLRLAKHRPQVRHLFWQRPNARNP